MIRKLAPEERGKHQNWRNKCKCTTATDQCYNPPPLFFIELHANDHIVSECAGNTPNQCHRHGWGPKVFRLQTICRNMYLQALSYFQDLESIVRKR